MSSGELEIARHRWVSSDDRFDEVSVINNATDTTILSFRTPAGLRGWLTDFRQAWDAGMDTFVDYTLKVNGAVIYPYIKKKVQVAAPEQDVALPVALPVQGGSLVEVIANQAAGGTTGNFAARVIVKYTDPLEDKRP